MKKNLTSSIKYLSVFLVFIVLFIIPTILLPVSPSLLEKINPEEMKSFFPLLLLVALYLTSAYWLLIKNINQNKIVTFVKLSAANFLLYPIMIYIESVFWLEPLEMIDSNEYIKIFFRFLITFTLFSAYLALISKNKTNPGIKEQSSINYKLISQKIFLIAIIYIILYNLFGYFVAWQFEATRIYYTGDSELKGFFPMIFQNVSDAKFMIVQLVRGILFGLSGYLFYSMLACSKNKKLLILALIFGGFGFQLILPNPIFPEMVRISHFIETTSSMIIFGLIIGIVFSYQKRQNSI